MRIFAGFFFVSSAKSWCLVRSSMFFSHLMGFPAYGRMAWYWGGFSVLDCNFCRAAEMRDTEKGGVFLVGFRLECWRF